MKRFLLSYSALLLAAVLVVSCNKNSPKEVATTWLNSFYHMDYEAAKKVSTEDTKNIISQMQQLTAMVSDSMKKDMKRTTITVKDVQEKGDTAVATYTISESPTKEEKLDLVKKDGKWLVAFNKGSSMGDGDSNGAGAGDQPTGADSTSAGATDTTMSDGMKH